MFSFTVQPSKLLHPKNSKELYTNNISCLYTLAMIINFNENLFFLYILDGFFHYGSMLYDTINIKGTLEIIKLKFINANLPTIARIYLAVQEGLECKFSTPTATLQRFCPLLLKTLALNRSF